MPLQSITMPSTVYRPSTGGRRVALSGEPGMSDGCVGSALRFVRKNLSMFTY